MVIKYIIDKINIVKEVFDNEAILVNIPSGKYYSISGNEGLLLLKILENPIDFDQLVHLFLLHFKCDSSILTKDISDNFSTLIREKIIIETEELYEFNDKNLSLVPKEYTPIQFIIYDDLQELIQLDPVHDVRADKGWPHKK